MSKDGFIQASIAWYLAHELAGSNENDSASPEVMAETTPYPEMARDILDIVRIADAEAEALSMNTPPKIKREQLDRLLHFMKSEPGKSPFEEWVIDFLELMLDYIDKGPAI